MRSIASSLVLLGAPALVLASGPAASPVADAKPSPEPASSVATVWPARPPTAPPGASAPPAPPSPPAPAPPGPGPGPGPHAVPSQVVVEKLGKGDRLSLAGDHRNALFVYQDAVYMQPAYAPARVRLGRAYLVLGYPAQAVAQAEAALAADPGSEEARTLLAEARVAPSRAAALPAGVPAGPPLAPPPMR